MEFRKQTPVGIRGAYPLHFCKKGLRFEIVREHYDAARFSANINPVSSRVHIGWASRMNIPRKGGT